MKKYSTQDLIQRLVWAIAGYFLSLYGIVVPPGSIAPIIG